MKLATIVLAIAFALPNTFALAEGPMNLADPVVAPSQAPLSTRHTPVATEPGIFPEMRSPPSRMVQAGQTPLAMCRGG